MKPYAASCDDNKEVILEVIKPYLKNKRHVLEIASGTGQHAVFFAQACPDLKWQPSDLANNLQGIQYWLNDALCANLLDPIELDVSQQWPSKQYDAVFTANSLHIMTHQQVADCFSGLGKILSQSAVCLFYGPFNYAGSYTSDSNKNFDVWLKNKNSGSCIKDFESICSLAKQQGLTLLNDNEKPANNRVLAFMKH